MDLRFDRGAKHREHTSPYHGEVLRGLNPLHSRVSEEHQHLDPICREDVTGVKDV